MLLHPVILAGGSGTRLWPLSREYHPKQFLGLTGSRSMVQETVFRLDGLRRVASPIIVCNEEHRFLVAEQIRELGRWSPTIILEPSGRNTAPALALAALHLIAQQGEANDPVMLAMPADHVIRDVTAFQSVVQRGAALACEGALVTLGVVPDSPATGYGYIREGEPLDESRSAFRLSRFVEKPDAASAKTMVESGDHLWNSGIFMMRASVWLKALERHSPQILRACRAAHAAGATDGRFYRPDSELFAACPSDSIDYAVMEKLTESAEERDRIDAVVLPMDADWSDVGAWSALWEDGARDGLGNVVQGDVYARSVRNSLLIGNHRLLAAVGLEDLIVVETSDAVLVANRDRVQDVKDLVEELKSEGRREQENHRKVHRPWGSYETLDSGPGFQVKRLTVNPGAALSLQMHHRRAEHWVVVKGAARVTRADEQFPLRENESAYVPVGVRHRLENPEAYPLEIIEVQSGDYLGEDDIVRFEDRYNRHRPKRQDTPPVDSPDSPGPG